MADHYSRTAKRRHLAAAAIMRLEQKQCKKWLRRQSPANPSLIRFPVIQGKYREIDDPRVTLRASTGTSGPDNNSLRHKFPTALSGNFLSILRKGTDLSVYLHGVVVREVQHPYSAAIDGMIFDLAPKTIVATEDSSAALSNPENNRQRSMPNLTADGIASIGSLDMVMPSEQRYRGFLDALRKNARVFEAAEYDEQRLDAALAVLRGVVLYLLGDEEIADERLARPLGWLESAVNDSRRGARVAALRPAEPISGRPIGLARERVQGALAFGVELLVMAAKVPPAEAADFIASKARKLLVSESGDEITAAQVAGWRRELSRGRGTAGGREYFRELRQGYLALFKAPSASERIRCEVLALAAIKGASVVSPRSAPSRRGGDSKTKENPR